MTAGKIHQLPPLPVRFFLYDGDKNDIVEVNESEFLDADSHWPISYDRYTIRENGCSQICLTKMPEW